MVRAYTLDEIDDMRRSVSGITRAKNVERMLQTYIMAGVKPEDLRKKADEYAAFLGGDVASRFGNQGSAKR